jgi:hypothetical protein
MARKWTFLIKIFVWDLKDESREYGSFEPRGISPYKGPLPGLKQISSLEFDQNPNAMAIANFVSNIGDTNTLSFSKLDCPMTNVLIKANQKQMVLDAINFYVTPISSIPKGLKGQARLNAIFANSLTSVTLKTVRVPQILNVRTDLSGVWYRGTFEAKEVTPFSFKGTHW